MTENEYLIIFKSFFEKHYNSLRFYAMRIVGSYDASEDIVQDCFLELWQKRQSIDFSTSLKNYLYKSVFNRSVNYVKSKANTMEDTDSCITMINKELCNQMIDGEELLIYKDLSLGIAKGVKTLPNQCQKIFIMSRTDEMKNKEIAEKLNISVKAVEKQITNALKLLRSYLKKNEFMPILLCVACHYLVS